MPFIRLRKFPFIASLSSILSSHHFLQNIYRIRLLLTTSTSNPQPKLPASPVWISTIASAPTRAPRFLPYPLETILSTAPKLTLTMTHDGPQPPPTLLLTPLQVPQPPGYSAHWQGGLQAPHLVFPQPGTLLSDATWSTPHFIEGSDQMSSQRGLLINSDSSPPSTPSSSQPFFTVGHGAQNNTVSHYLCVHLFTISFYPRLCPP